MKKRVVKPAFATVTLLALAVGLLGAWRASGQTTPPGHRSIAVDYQPVPIGEAERLTGLRLPMPTHLPEGYDLEGVYVYFRTLGTASQGVSAPTPQPKPGIPFQIRFENGPEWLVLRLYGGDTRSDEVYRETGDLPAAFGLSGETANVAGTPGLQQTGLDEQSFASGETRIRSRLVWRLAYTSSEDANLRAIFLALESLSPGDGLSRAEMIRVAESIP